MKPKKCEHNNCDALADYKAPKHRNEPFNYVWFCLEHIREYNNNWNYYDGMNEYEIETDRKHDQLGRRPTWRFTPKSNIFKDNFSFQDFYQPPKIIPLKDAEKKALNLLDLEYPFTTNDLKRNYNKKVKEYHPDLNRGSKECEEKLKKINDAYQRLKSHAISTTLNSNTKSRN